MGRIMTSAALPSLLLTAACTTSLSTQPVETAAGAVVEGTQYSLPVLQYTLTVRRMLTACATGADGTLHPEFTTSVEPSAKHVAGEQFVVDPQALAGFMKTSSFEMETYDNGTIKSINAAAVDHGPEVALGLVDLGLNIARLTMGPANAPTLALSRNTVRPSCPTEALKELDERLAAQRSLTRQINSKLEQIAPYERLAAIGALSEDDKKAFRQLQEELGALRKSLAAVDALVKAAQAPLSYTDTYDWIPSRKDSSKVISFPDTGEEGRRIRQLEWLARLFIPLPEISADQEADVRQALIAAGSRIKDLLAAQGAANLSLVAVVFAQQVAGTNAINITCPGSREQGPGPGSGGRRWSVSARPGSDKCILEGQEGSTAPELPGIAYRMPVQAILRVCEGSVPKDCDSRMGTLKVYAESSSLVPQMGRLAILPFSNGFGEDNALAATFRPDGSLSKAKYDTRKSVAKSIVDTLNAGAGRLLDYRDERKAEQLTELERQITLAKKQKELIEATDALATANAAARVQAQALESRIAQLEAEQTIRALELSMDASARAKATQDDD
jgi:hypothetical protein